MYAKCGKAQGGMKECSAWNADLAQIAGLDVEAVANVVIPAACQKSN